MIDALYFTFLGLLGAFVHILADAEKWEDIIKFAAVRGLIIGAIVGYIYNILHFEYNFPNSIMALVCGYSGTDFLEVLVKKYYKFKGE